MILSQCCDTRLYREAELSIATCSGCLNTCATYDDDKTTNPADLAEREYHAEQLEELAQINALEEIERNRFDYERGDVDMAIIAICFGVLLFVAIDIYVWVHFVIKYW